MQKIMNWIDDRFPLTALWESQWGKYVAPKNFNFWYYFGSLATLVLVLQIVTGILLTMNYKPDAARAFESVEYIMRDVEWGWLIRYMHSTGASMFFIVVYLHMFRGLMYGSYRKPRELLWIFGCLIYLTLMGEAFFGYLLPWGQMSYWGAQVIVNLFATVPLIGEDLAHVDPRRLHDLGHHAEPLLRVPRDRVAAGAAGSRRRAPHGAARGRLQQSRRHRDQAAAEGSRDRASAGRHLSAIRTTRSRTSSAWWSSSRCSRSIVFFMPDMGGYFLEANNFIPANPLKTPEHIAPVWYFTPYYAMLRAVPSCCLDSQFWGVLVDGRGGADLLRAALARPRQGEVDPLPRHALQVVARGCSSSRFLILGYLGVVPVTVWGQFPEAGRCSAAPTAPPWSRASLTIVYFLFFLLMPWYTARDKTKPVPERVTGR